jgi:hypothetical protein
MKGKYIVISALAGTFFIASCGGNDDGKNNIAGEVVKTDTAAPKPTGPPARVSGTFKGILPCDGCRETEAILDIKDDSYSFTRLFKGMKKKGSNINNQSGSCVFDSGIVKLLNTTNTVEYMFRILSQDSIKHLDITPKAAKKTDFFLVRSSTQGK